MLLGTSLCASQDDATPLSVLASASASGDIGAGDSVVIEAALKSAGGVFGRRSSDASSTPTPLVQQAAAGGAGGHSGFVSTSAGRRPGLDLCTEDSDED